MTVQKLNKRQVYQVVQLCQQELSDSFFARLGEDFLQLFFAATIDSKYSFTVVAGKDNQIVGFATGVFDKSGLLPEMLRKYPLGLFRVIGRQIIKQPMLLLKIKDTLIASKKLKVKPQLLYLAVKKNYQRRGVGTLLLRQVKKEFSRQGVEKFCVGFYSDMKEAKRFYEKTGGKFFQELAVGERKLVYYIYQAKI